MAPVPVPPHPPAPELPSVAGMNIRIGLPKPIPGLEGLEGQTRLFNVQLTWQEAFLKEFGISVDPLRYSVTRVHRTQSGKNSNRPPKHSLMEDISVLMSEFKKSLSSYSVHVVENLPFQHRIEVNPSNVHISPSNRNDRNNVDVDGDVDMNNEEERQPPRLSPAHDSGSGSSAERGSSRATGRKIFTNAGRGAKGAETMSPSPRAKRESTNQNSIASRNINPFQGRSSASPADPTGNGAVDANNGIRKAVVNNRKLFTRKPGLAPPPPFHPRGGGGGGSGSKRIKISSSVLNGLPVAGGSGSISAGRNQNGQQQQSNRNSGLGLVLEDLDMELRNGLPNSGQGDNDDVDDDVISVASQDSQVADLMELGICNSDIRSLFVARAQNNYTNSQLLKARHELETLKKHKSSRWTKWTLSAPITTNIIRDLLGI